MRGAGLFPALWDRVEGQSPRGEGSRIGSGGVLVHAGWAYTGVDLARAERPDVVLCDIGLPRLDGYGVAKMLRESSETAGTRLIAVTGNGSTEDRQRTCTAGFDAHLVKPIDLEELLRQLKPGNLAGAMITTESREAATFLS